ncbi:MAG: hypothetical protein RMI30_00395 [Thermodesulfovibrio sp.]|nr:hypothetical protein [Thermodesulfovibrio sp.]MDW7997901.1 hypothetical protein [Thermodesulfovibrio sp.]
MEKPLKEKSSKYWSIYHLIVGSILYSTIKASGIYDRILSFFYIASGHSSAIFYGFIAGLTTIAIILAGYIFSKFIVNLINKSQMSNKSKDILKVAFPLGFFVFLSVILYIPYTQLSKQEEDKKLSTNYKALEGGEKVITATTIQPAQGLRESDFNQVFLKNIEKWLIETITKKARQKIAEMGHNPEKFKPKYTANSGYVIVEGKKLAIIKIKFEEIFQTVTIIGIRGNELVRVTCIRLDEGEIFLWSGACGEEIRKAFGIRFPKNYLPS